MTDRLAAEKGAVPKDKLSVEKDAMLMGKLNAVKELKRKEILAS